jgi:hypothetical protein
MKEEQAQKKKEKKQRKAE